MSQYPTDPVPSMTSDFQLSGEPPAWPKVVGIISIVLSALGVICGLCGAVFILGMSSFMQKFGEMQAQGGGARGGPVIPTTPMPVELAPGVLSVVSVIVGPIGSIVLLIAGIATVRRVASGRMLHLAYVGISVLAIVIGLIGAYQYQSTGVAFLAAHPDDPWSKMFAAQGGMGRQFLQSMAISCVTAIYPIFCLVWFGVMGKRPEVGAVIQEPLV